jgi:uncharacterized membrane protein
MQMRPLLLALAVLAGASATAQAKSYHLTQNRIDAQVYLDGAMHVRENITFDFRGSFHHALRRVPLPPGTEVSNVEVREGGAPFGLVEGEQPGTYHVTRSRGGFEIDWYYQTADESRTFTVEYDVSGAVQKHSDVAELYWKFVGPDCEVPTDSVAVSVRLPEPIPADQVRVWGHGPLWGVARPREGGAEFVARRVPPKTMVEVRVVFPTQVMASSPRSDMREAWPGIVGQERHWAEHANLDRQVARAELVAPAVIVVGGILVWIILFVRYGREFREPIAPPEYLREAPGGWTPVHLGYLWRWGSLNTSDLTASVMDLVRRGALKMMVTKESHPRLGGLLGTKVEEECCLQWVKGYQGELTDAERYLIRDILFELGVPGDTTSLSELHHRARQDQQGSYRRYQAWQAMAKWEAEQRFPVVDPASRKAMVVGIMVGVVLFGSVFLLGPMTQSLTALVAAPVGLAMMPASLLLRRRNPLAAQALHQWQAFRRYLTDFSELRQYPAPAVELWDQYLVYAITLGVADRVIEQFKTIYPRVVSEDGHAHIFQNWVSADGQPFSLSGFDAVGHAFSSFGQAMSIATSSFTSASGGGGGFSGGGGGGGGGGGVSAD